ncbi:MAG: restriction endonuclease subunit S [Burkholderiales bacterium]|nr:restriction endonuclease subunit S [Burkholderiales bacterium]
MSRLPESWAALSLGEVISYGQTDKAEPGDIGSHEWVLELEDIEKDTSRVINRLSFAQRQSKSTKNRFKKGDVLYGKLRPYLNKVVRADDDGVCTTEIIPIRGNAAVSASYLFYWLKHPVFLTYVSDVSHGVNMPRLGTEAGRAAPFVLAPLPEQRRIADKLDTTLARVDACRDRLARVAPLLKRFRQSVLAAATSGRLTEDWRAKQVKQPDEIHDSIPAFEGVTPWTVPDKWRWVRVESICEFITKGTTPAKEKMAAGSGEIPYLKVYNLTFNGMLDFTVDPTYVDRQTHENELKRSVVVPHDVLMNIVGPPLGKVSVVPDTFPEWNINQAIARFRPRDKVNSRYLADCLMSSALIDYAARQAKATAGQFNLTLEICRDLPIPLPHMVEQLEIVHRVETLLAFADRLEARLTSAQTAADRLTPALLAKAFRGELVPQDPNDEPASELLKRLTAQRAAEPNPKRTRKAG